MTRTARRVPRGEAGRRGDVRERTGRLCMGPGRKPYRRQIVQGGANWKGLDDHLA